MIGTLFKKMELQPSILKELSVKVSKLNCCLEWGWNLNAPLFHTHNYRVYVNKRHNLISAHNYRVYVNKRHDLISARKFAF